MYLGSFGVPFGGLVIWNAETNLNCFVTFKYTSPYRYWYYLYLAVQVIENFWEKKNPLSFPIFRNSIKKKKKGFKLGVYGYVSHKVIPFNNGTRYLKTEFFFSNHSSKWNWFNHSALFFHIFGILGIVSAMTERTFLTLYYTIVVFIVALIT